MLDERRQNVAVIGTGVSGLAAAWMLSRTHNVTVFEKADYVGGHCNTVDVDVRAGLESRTIPVDTGFIVYNERTYPNLTAWFNHLDIATERSDMSFSASIAEGHFEYSGNSIWTMIAQKRNLLRPRFWRMVADLVRFYRGVVHDTRGPNGAEGTLGDYLKLRGYGEEFLHDHLLPVAACIWSASLDDILAYPLAAFVRFFENHGLLELRDANRPQWRTVTGGSRVYVSKVSAAFKDRIRLNCGVRSVRRHQEFVEITTDKGTVEVFDQVVIATHTPQALAMLADPTAAEKSVLGAIRYAPNAAILHSDASLMPVRRKAWASWNYLAAENRSKSGYVCLTYWMNMLQNIDHRFPLFVTLNAYRQPKPGTVFKTIDYEHPIFDHAAIGAQKNIWTLQGRHRTWYCGAYCGHGFHEDGLQAGLAVGEALIKAKRPWTVANESGRIWLPEPAGALA